MTTRNFADILIDAIRRVGSPACVGLDPAFARLPAELRSRDEPGAVLAFCEGVVEASAPFAAAIKIQSACFERLGARGWDAMAALSHRARGLGMAVILDAKRGDIGVTAEHYAAAARALGADCITVNPYLGPETLRPYLAAGLGIFALVRTSNPDSDKIQSLALADGRTVAEMVADLVAALGQEHLGASGYSAVGAVVGATKPADGRALRARMPRQFFLVPGYGAQGGTADDVAALADERAECGRGVLVNASRAVIYAFESSPGKPWRAAIAAAAQAFNQDIARIAG